jgi:formylglycine-generating enzyme required for sulfatase activity
LHRNGILHRDFKPENILIGPDFTPKVTDFGIAVDYASAGSLTKTDQWLGTIGYVAPEQQYRLKVDERADQYSMAAVIYEVLTGQKPLGVFKSPSQLNKLLDFRIDEVLMRALQEDRDDRLATIQDFGTALDAALAPPPIVRRPRGRSAPLPLTFVSLLAVFAITWWVMRQGDHGLAKGDSRTHAVTRWTNSLGMNFVWIPAGEFMMGSPESDPLTRPLEKRAHSVRITRPFYLSVHEVTVGQFREFIKATGYRTDAESRGRGGHVYDAERDELLQDPHYLWCSPTAGKSAEDNEPVVQVSWNDAVAFCRWLSKREGRVYRLPTEAEWEYACRARSRGRWCMGDDVKDLGAFAWTETNSGLLALPHPHPVGRKAPNAFGLFDMHGNVWEWTQDRFAPYPDGPEVDPVGPTIPIERVLRGGSWEKGELMQTRSGARRDSLPDYAYFAYGFRVCAPM